VPEFAAVLIVVVSVVVVVVVVVVRRFCSRASWLGRHVRTLHS
jgi:hypothetical protein